MSWLLCCSELTASAIGQYREADMGMVQTIIQVGKIRGWLVPYASGYGLRPFLALSNFWANSET